jgi:hypothetical protein
MRVQSWKVIPFLVVTLLFFTAIETQAAAPTITSLSPTSGAVGASVTTIFQARISVRPKAAVQ